MLYIKNMVCDRCIRVVREELQGLGLDVRNVELGEVEIGQNRKSKEMKAVKDVLRNNGFELIEDKNAKIIEEIKKTVIQFVHTDHTGARKKIKYSDYIVHSVGKDYHSLSTLFSLVENVTIEQYIIKQRIERVKELLKYDEKTLSEIAFLMDYSSVQHLSNQFKSVTGLTAGQFKKLTQSHSHHLRIPLDKIH